MTDQTETVAAADAAGSQFAKAFLPGLVLGLVIGLFIGAWLPPFFGEKAELVPAPPRDPQSAEDRVRDEGPNDGDATPAEGDTAAPATGDPSQGEGDRPDSDSLP